MTKHIEIRKKLRSFVLKDDFYAFIDKVVLTSRERLLLERFYLDGSSIGDIADELNLTEYAILKLHQKILKKFEELL